MIIRALSVATLLLTSGIALQAATFQPSTGPVAMARTINPTAEVAMLRTAYDTLAKADHDYKGHRALAMRAIEKACDILGTDIRDKGKDRIPQPLSDADLREARREVAEVRDGSKEANQIQVNLHLIHAVQELDIALTIK